MKRGYDRLHRLATNQGPDSEFTHTVVEELWQQAKKADFQEEELESLRMELVHYER